MGQRQLGRRDFALHLERTDLDRQREFALWLEAGERATVTERRTMACNHPGLTTKDLAAGVHCGTCAIYDGDGGYLGQSGKREDRRDPLPLADARHPRARSSMGDPAAAHAHFELAVTALQRRYREVPLTPIARPKSDAQLDAEAAA